MYALLVTAHGHCKQCKKINTETVTVTTGLPQLSVFILLLLLLLFWLVFV